MKKMILSFSDNDMEGYEGRWEFYLQGKRGGAYTLSCRHIPRGDEPVKIDLVNGLRNGIDVNDALHTMVFDDASYSLGEDQLQGIAEELAFLDPSLAEEFRQGQKLLEQRLENERQVAASERESKLRAYRDIIDKYVERFSDDPLRYPGGGAYGTRRNWVRHFIEDYVLAHGRLPTGEHRIDVRIGGVGYSGGAHDFSDLK
jgi:hypothetical protein